MAKKVKQAGKTPAGVKNPKKGGLKAQKASCSKNGEVEIYDGIVKCGESERNNWAFWSIWKNLNEYGNQECADEEEIPPKYRELNHMDAALRWEDIFKDATKRLWLYARTELELFDIPEPDREKVKDCIVSYMNNVEQAGQEIDTIMEEFASGDFDGDKDDFAEKVMKKMYYGIYVQICWAMNATKDCVREVIASNGYPLGEIGNGEEEDSALTILKLLKNGEIGKGDFKDTTIEEAKLKMLQLCPFNDEVVAYCYRDDGGEGPINDIVREAKIDIEKLNEKLPSGNIGGTVSSPKSRRNGHRREGEKDKKIKMCEVAEAAIATSKPKPGKRSKQKEKAVNTSKLKAGEVAIYGGIVKNGLPEYANWSFWSFWKDLAEYGDQECADEEKSPPKYRDISPDEAAHSWESILKEAEKDLRRHVKWELKLFDLPDDCYREVDNFISKLLNNVRNVGDEIDEMMAIFVSGDYDGDKETYADKIMRKLHFGIFVQICSAVNSTKDFLRRMIEENGWALGESGVSDNEDAASAILELLENDEIGKGDFADTGREEAKLKMLQFCPFKKDVVSYCYLDDNGKGPINDIARAARVDVNPLKRELLKKIVGDADLSTESRARDYRDRIVKAAGELELDISEDLAEIDAALKRLDREYRTVDGREFPTRDEADKQRKLSEFEAKLDLSSEESAIEAKAKLEKFIKKLGVEGAWKMERVTQALECFDKQARRAGDRIFETREEAAKQRELVEFEKSGKITDEASAIKFRSDIVAMATRLGIDGSWKLKRVDGELKRFDKLARTAFGVVYPTRGEAEEKRSSPEAFFRAVETAITATEDNGFYFKESIPPKKLAGARTYLSGNQDNDVFAVLDTTLFGSAKNGLAVSRWGIVWKNETVKTTRNSYAWNELAALGAPSKPERGEITFEKGVVFDFTGSNGDSAACRDTLAQLIGFAKEATCLDRLSISQDGPTEEAAVDLSDFATLTCDRLFTGDAIPDKKRKNAFVSMKVAESIDAICLLLDSTVFGSAKEGLVISDKAVYFKNIFEDPIRTPLAAIQRVEAKENALVINNRTFQSTGVSKEVLKKIAGWIKTTAGQKGGENG